MSNAGALCAKARAMYGKRLTAQDYDELTHKQSLGDVVTYLKNQTAYHDLLADINVRTIHRGELEHALTNHYYSQLQKLVHYGKRINISFYSSEITSIEIGLIIDKIYSLKDSERHSFDLKIPDFLKDYSSFNLYGLINIKTYQELTSFLKQTKYYKILESVELDALTDIRAIERAFDELYYDTVMRTIRRNFNGNTYRSLADLIKVEIELANITKIYRFKSHFDEDYDRIKSTLFTKYQRMSNQRLDELVNAKDAQEVLKLLNETRYRFYLENGDFKYIEYYVLKIKANLASRCIWFSHDAPIVYLGYAILARIELENLKHIIESIRYNRTANEIEEQLILC